MSIILQKISAEYNLLSISEGFVQLGSQKPHIQNMCAPNKYVKYTCMQFSYFSVSCHPLYSEVDVLTRNQFLPYASNSITLVILNIVFPQRHFMRYTCTMYQ